jgi:hypothetical protein
MSITVWFGLLVDFGLDKRFMCRWREPLDDLRGFFGSKIDGLIDFGLYFPRFRVY